MPNLYSENTEVVNALIKRALEGKHNDFEFITSFNTYRAARLVAKTADKVAAGMEKAQAMALEKYTDQLESGIDTFALLMDSITLGQCAKYYQEESNLVWNEIYEYECYLRLGHFVDMILGKERPEEDLVDFSGNGWKPNNE